MAIRRVFISYTVALLLLTGCGINFYPENEKPPYKKITITVEEPDKDGDKACKVDSGLNSVSFFRVQPREDAFYNDPDMGTINTDAKPLEIRTDPNSGVIVPPVIMDYMHLEDDYILPRTYTLDISPRENVRIKAIYYGTQEIVDNTLVIRADTPPEKMRAIITRD